MPMGNVSKRQPDHRTVHIHVSIQYTLSLIQANLAA